MSLDVSTLYVVATLVAGMLGCLLLFFWRQEKIPALGFWAAAYLIGAVSIGVWSLAGSYLRPGALLLVSAAGFVACGLVWGAARVFHGRPAYWPLVLAGAAAWIAAGFFVPSSYLRTIVGTAIVAAYAAMTVSELWSERRKSQQRRWPAAVIPMLHGLVLMLPIVLGGLMSPDGEALRPNSTWVVIYTIELVLYAVGTVFIIFMMVSDRAVRAHKAAASIDPLTGLLNRRGFGEATERMIEREARAGRPVSAMIFDIDHFKSVNDRFGHGAGDEVLKLFAAIVASNLRISDLVGRIGGEEFAALLPCAIEEAVLAGERVRECFENCGAEANGELIATTVSIGIASGPANTEVEVLLASADTALYRAKRGGRNRVEAASEEPLSLGGGRKQAVAATGRPPGPGVEVATSG